MKFLYASDLHGYDPFYREILALSGTQGISAVVLGGDLFPRKGHSDESLTNQKKYIQTSFRSFLREAKDKTGVSLYCILGNDDFAGTIPMMKEFEKENLLIFLHDKVVSFMDEISIAGYPFIPPTPFPVKDFEKRDLLEDNDVGPNPHAYVSSDGLITKMKAAEWFSRQCTIEEDMKDFKPPSGLNQKMIHVIHAPPFETALDCLYDGRSVGSRAVRKYIEESRPLITLHGHIHESPSVSGNYWQKIGQTLSINPGQNTERFSAVVCDLSPSEMSVSHTLLGKAHLKF